MATIAQSRRNNLWFGTEEKMGWLPTPNRGAQTGGTGWSAEGTTLNGGGFQLNSFGSHRQYIFEWPSTSSAKMAQLMKSYADGSFGRGLIYFLDPLIYMTNVLPAMWADPSMGIGQEGASLVYGVEASSLPTSGHEGNSLPVASAYYDLTGVAAGWRGKEDAVFIPIPDGYTLSLGSIHSQSGQGRVMYRTQARNGGLGTVSEVTPLPTSTSTLVNTFISGPDVAGAWLFVGKAGSGAGSVTLTAMTGRLIPSAKAVVTPFATNYAPSLLGPTADVEVYQNYAPFLDGPTTAVEVRRNYRTDPAPTLGSNFGGFGFYLIGQTNGNPSVAYSKSGLARSIQFTGASSAHGYANLGPMNWPTELVGQVFTCAMTVYWEGSGSITTTLQSSPVIVTRSDFGAIPAGVPTRVYVTYDVGNSSTAHVRARLNVGADLGPGKLEISDIDVYPGVYQPGREWFSGSYSPDPDLTPSWTGTTNNSESILTGLRPDGYTGTIYLHGDDVLRVPAGATGSLAAEDYAIMCVEAVNAGQQINSQSVNQGENRIDAAGTMVFGPGDWQKVGLFAGNPAYYGPLFDSYTQSPDPDMVYVQETGYAALVGRHLTALTDVNCVSYIHTDVDGKKWVRLVPTGANTDTRTYFTIPNTNGLRNGGTQLGTIRITDPLTGTPAPQSRRLRVISPESATTQAPNVPGVYPLRLNYGALTGTYWATFIHGGIAGSGTVDWSDLGLFPGDYQGPWFDGDSGIFSIGAQLVKASWDGAPWDSSATVYTTSVELEEVGLGPWIGGQGHSGCRFIGKPTEIKYGPINDGQVGFAASFREVGSWLYG